MVFQLEGYFQQFAHCKFKENVVRLLFIPTLEDGNVFLVVNKYGKVGLYEPQRLGLIHTYCLDLSVPMHPEMTTTLRQISKQRSEFNQAKCERTHLVVDAVYAPDLQCVLFATTKSIIQCYDIGEIETHNLGLETLPRQEFIGLRHGVSVATLKNKGHVETHRIFELEAIPSCMDYYVGQVTKVKGQNVEVIGKLGSKLLIGDVQGGVTIVQIDNPKFPFLGHRKIRGVLHKITLNELRMGGKVKWYKGHTDLVKDLRFLGERQWIVSSSRDNKFSLFCEDCTEIQDSFIISLPKGVSSLTCSDTLKMIMTGSEDGVIRLFNQFSMRMPQMELLGHRSSIVALEVLQVPFSDNPILISFSTDVEIRGWDPVHFVCLQSVYLRFPLKSTIICKTPEFAKRALVIHQPHFYTPPPLHKALGEGKDKPRPTGSKDKEAVQAFLSVLKREKEGSIILLYCNSYAKLNIEKDSSHWPFDLEEFLTDFELLGWNDKKLKRDERTESKDPKLAQLSSEEESCVEIQSKIMKDNLMDLKSRIYKNGNAAGNYSGLDLKLGDQLSKKLGKISGKTRSSFLGATLFDKIAFEEIQDPQVNPDIPRPI